MEAGIWTIWDRNPTSNELKQTNMYKVGDKIRVKSDLQVDETYGIAYYNSYMHHFAGKYTTIVSVYKDYYEVAIDAKKWNWTPEMFEDSPSNKLFKLM